MCDLDAALAAIWERSRPVLGERLEAVERAARAVGDGTLDEQTRHEGRHAAHQLAGSLGTFGLDECGDMARELEAQLDGPADPQRVAALSTGLRELLGPRLR